ncbi:hypothetical protein [Granulicella tundricola]|uniref:Lipoprotein n=1 Tax=Granulicella tundricola (strain ATCC BAA-1859 / DSM 23138 / MP5ACTX9) TaxID=1198114 RepID=E8X228_GRATM|nr:hypothetical protein [Granulicella tundricola]ADW70271.1 hypothetical protein AciX9_3260 [Granulicella tundricola MP5ACTX9]
MRLLAPAALLLAASAACAQQSAAPYSSLPDAPSQLLLAANTPAPELPESSDTPVATGFSSSLAPADIYDYTLYPDGYPQDAAAQAAKQSDQNKKKPGWADEPDLDANGNPIPLNRHQPKRILGFMPNYRSVSVGSAVHPPGWKYNFSVATRQSFDYSSFIFLGITSLTAEAINSHPALGKGVPGFYAYTWRGFLDKTDGTYLGAWFLPSLLHEDTRYYPLGPGHSIAIRALYVISRQGVARTYGGRQTPNIAGLGGKVLTQLISRNYYPAGTSDFGVLATKFAYSAMRDIGFSSIREFYPDIAAHYVRLHHEKAAAQAARDAAAAAAGQSNPATPAKP